MVTRDLIKGLVDLAVMHLPAEIKLIRRDSNNILIETQIVGIRRVDMNGRICIEWEDIIHGEVVKE